MSSSFSGDRRRIKTNGSLIPASPPHSGKPSDSHKDDQHLYDCPADIFNLSSSVKTPEKQSPLKGTDTSLKKNEKPSPYKASEKRNLDYSALMSISVYEDDRIYDSPADVMILPPSIPPHSKSPVPREENGRPAVPPHQTNRDTQHSADSDNSDLTNVSSTSSFRTAVELSSTVEPKVRKDNTSIN